ncbi:MAG: PAS domain S-box protein, partial [Candidatus Abyssubacteria bacterium]|nr:PAS domain S-box protein [Candidatus Abyssubacteria bacterium]
TEQKKAEEALKESEKRYRTLVDNSLTGICLLQDGKYQFVNKRLLDISGYSQEELVGMACENVIHPDDVKLVRKIIGRRMTGKYPGTQYQFRIVTKSGDVLWIETFGAPVEYKGRPALLVNMIDITERRKAEEALRLTQFTVDHSPDAVYWIAPDARFLYVNEAACHVLGYTREELLSMSVHDMDPNFTTDVWPGHWEDLKERGSFTVETQHRTKDGRVLPVQVTVNYLEFMGREYNCAVAHDITNRKQAEEQIRQSEEKYRTLFEESKDCVFITAPQGAFLDINPAGVELFGYSSKKEVLKADLARDVYVNPADRDIFQKMMVRQGFVKDYELPLKKKDGSELIVLVTANAERDEEGSVVAYRGIMRDTTEQKRLEQQLFQVQKMEGIGTLAGGIAHDFNNILGGILGYASFMKTKMDGEHPFFNYIDTIERGAMRAAELTAQLLAFARGGKYETRPIDLNRIVDETLKLIGKTFDKSIEIETRLPLELPTVEADAAQMHQVLMNLCVNASDAMPDGGRLIIETSVQEFSEQYVKTQMASKSGAYVCMSVTDSGIGMDKESMQRMFEPFFTTKEHGKGTGLGLSMVYGVVKNHGGFLNVYSKVGKGTTVKVYLPASGKTETIRPTRTEALTGGNELILVVDDEEPIRSLAKEILEAYGYRVLLAEDGVGAVNVFKEHMDDINLVILDMVMPRMGGREAFLQMRQLDPQTKALLSTGYSQDGRAQEILDNGVMGFVQKPYQVEVLLLIVRKVLDAKLGAKI